MCFISFMDYDNPFHAIMECEIGHNATSLTDQVNQRELPHTIMTAPGKQALHHHFLEDHSRGSVFWTASNIPNSQSKWPRVWKKPQVWKLPYRSSL